MSTLEELKVFTGNAHPQLARDVCDYLGIPLGESETFKFANDNTFVRIGENIRERDVFIVQPTVAPTNDNLMELLIMIDACKAGVGRSHHGSGVILRLRAHRQEGPAPGAHHRPAGGRSYHHRRRRPGADPGPPRRSNTRVFQHPGGRVDRGAHPVALLH